MWTLDNLWSNVTDLLEESEQAVENTLGTEFDIFTASKHEIEKSNQAKIDQATEKAQNAVLDVKKNVVKTSILNQLKSWFDSFKSKVDKLPIPSEQKNEIISEIQNEYNDIKSTIEWYNNDGDFKKWFSIIDGKVADWIDTLITKRNDKMNHLFAWQIIDSSIHSLSILKADLGILNWVTKESIENSKTQLNTKYEKGTDWDDEATSMLTKIWVPAWIAGILVWVWKTMWLFWVSNNWDKWFLSKFLNILKNPISGLMELFGFWWDTSTVAESNATDTDKEATTNQNTQDNKVNLAPIAESAILTKTEKWVKYAHKNITLETENKSFSEILIWNVRYQLNLNNQPDLWLWDININQRENWDILKVWDTEIDLLKFAEQINLKQPKEQYTLKEDFRLMWDIVIEKIS